jgi:diguanylate cyclase (GGDEF)-like protein/PAS domain S-box-containing protein
VVRGDILPRNHKRPTTATISAVVLVLVTILVGAAGILGLNTMQGGLDEITVARVPALDSLYATEHYLDSADAETLSAIYAYTHASYVQRAGPAAANRTRASRSFQQYQSYTAGDRQTPTGIKSSQTQRLFTDWLTVNRRILRQADLGAPLPDDTAAAATILEQQSMESLSKAFTSLIQSNKRDIQAADARGAASHNQAVVELLLVMTITILGAIVLQSRLAAREHAFRAVSEELRQREEYFRSLVQNSSDVVTVMTADTTIQYQSPSILRVCGYAPTEMIGRPLTDLLHMDDVPHAGVFFAELLGRPGVSASTGWRMCHHDGSWRDVETVGVNLLDDPSVQAIVLNSRDITERKQLEERLVHQALHDSLTDLPNHGALVEALNTDLARARRFRRHCAVLFLDIDHFKAINDTCGHQDGDAVLRAFATIVLSNLRATDTIGRWGGEEFMAVLPETDLAGAMLVAERRRIAVAGHGFPTRDGRHATCSIGVAVFPDDGENRDDLIGAADRAMYAAKRLGRNQVRAANEQTTLALENLVGASGSRDDSALVGTIEALAALVQVRDRYTGQHNHEVAQLAVQLAVSLHLEAPQVRLVEITGRLHDVGKVAVPDAVLQKPGRLSAEEWALIHTHPGVGAEVINHIPALRLVAPLIRAHHEHWDGSGYPDGLAGDAIPLGARIVAVADAFGAMTTNRPYRDACSPLLALAELRRYAGTQFDPEVVTALEHQLTARPLLVASP